MALAPREDTEDQARGAVVEGPPAGHAGELTARAMDGGGRAAVVQIKAPGASAISTASSSSEGAAAATDAAAAGSSRVTMAAAAGGATTEPITTAGADADGRAFRWWKKPGVWSAVATAASDLLTWGVFLGVGVPLSNFKLSGMVAAGVALAGLAVQGYRFWWEQSLRTFPKVHPTLLTATWIVNGIFCACVPRPTAQRYCLLLVLSGIVAADVVSLALDRPMALELAMEEVASAEEEGHPIFQRSCRRLSWGLLVLNVLQWPCFLAAAVFLKNPTDLLVLTLVAIVPVSLLVCYVVLAVVYGFIERALLEEALRTGVDSSEGMDILAVAYDKLRSLLSFLPQRKQQGQGDAGSPEKDEEAP